MIDIESLLFSELATALRAEFPGVFVTGEEVSAPSKFPCVAIAERSNTTYTRTLDSSHNENHAVLMWQIDYYSNLTKGKKAQCKDMAKVVDGIMIGYNFTRAFFEPTSNADTSIYRMTARYRAVISKEKQIYQ